MPSGPLAKRLLLLSGVGLVVLLFVGLALGAIGSAVFDRDNPFLHEPAIHLAPQPVFPAHERNEHLGLTADGHQEDGAAEPSDEGEEEELHGEPLGVMEFAVTNTLLSSWLASVLLIGFFVLGAQKRSLVPGRFQNLVEMVSEGLLNFSTSVLGADMARKAFPVVATIFFFVLFNAWLALFPFYQILGFTLPDSGQLQAHLFRSAGTDLNMPLALALVSFFFVEYWGFRSHGFGYLGKFLAVGNLVRLRPSGIIDAFVGLLELISELVRIVSFTFRLFGNLTAGEILVVMITFLVPFVATQFVFGLELLVGLIQSVIFAGLTLVFLAVAVRQEEH